MQVFLIAAVSLLTEHRLSGAWLQWLQLLGSRAQAQELWPAGLAAPWHTGSSQIRDGTGGFFTIEPPGEP